jgi:hypothetical protein
VEPAAPVPEADLEIIRDRIRALGRSRRRGKVRLMVATDKRMKRLLGPWDLERMDLSKRATQAWIIGEIMAAVEELTSEE